MMQNNKSIEDILNKRELPKYYALAETDPKDMSVGDRLKFLRFKLIETGEVRSRKEFIKIIGITSSDLTKYEQSDRFSNIIHSLLKSALRLEFNANMDWILTGEGNMLLVDAEEFNDVLNNAKNLLAMAVEEKVVLTNKEKNLMKSITKSFSDAIEFIFDTDF